MISLRTLLRFYFLASSFKGEGADGNEHLIDYILDAAGQKGTGKWTSMNAADLGVPLTLVSEAVFARCLSSLVDERRRVLRPAGEQFCSETIRREASQILAGPADIPQAPATLEQDIRDALLASKIISYAQVRPPSGASLAPLPDDADAGLHAA